MAGVGTAVLVARIDGGGVGGEELRDGGDVIIGGGDPDVGGRHGGGYMDGGV